MERLYPDLGQSTPPRLNLSNAFNTAGFKTVNDQVLMEMNLRAQKQLEEATKTPPRQNVLGYQRGAQQPSHRVRSPRSPGWSQRFSQLHGRQFARMESIESHPSVTSMRPIKTPVSPSKQLPRSQSTRMRPGMAAASAALPVEEKRQGDGPESPSKRRRTVVKSQSTTKMPTYEPINPQTRPMLQTNSFRARAPAASAAPPPRQKPAALPKQLARPHTPPKRMVRSQTTAHFGRPAGPADSLPSYARPTQAAMRKSQSTRALSSKGDSFLNQMPDAPKERHSPHEARELLSQLKPAPRSLHTRHRRP